MDSKILAQLIRELLVDNDRVCLPEIGSFVAEISPAYFSEDGTTINPPSRKVTFKSAEIWNDGLIEKYHAEKFKLDPEKSKKELNVYFAELKKKVEAKKSIKFPEIGKLRSTIEGNLFFTMDDNVSFNTGLMGLDSISLTDLALTNQKEFIPVREIKSKAEGDGLLKKTTSPKSSLRVQKRQKRTIVLLSVFVILLICTLLLLVFKEEAATLMEEILYTPQEIELLRQWETNSTN